MTGAKASCLYPNAGRAMKEAAAKGFDNAVVLDPNGNVAEFATSNPFTVADGVGHTPIPNGTFLNGITRQRVINFLRGRDVEVVERSMTPADLVAADEIFSTGNHGKVVPVIRYDDHDLQQGPLGQLVQDLYRD
jgi:branched-chain amino acid aminotransferase